MYDGVDATLSDGGKGGGGGVGGFDNTCTFSGK